MRSLILSIAALCFAVQCQAGTVGSLNTSNYSNSSPGCAGSLAAVPEVQAAPSCGGQVAVVAVACRTPIRDMVARALQRASARAQSRRVRLAANNGCAGSASDVSSSARVSVDVTVETAATHVVPTAAPSCPCPVGTAVCPTGACPVVQAPSTPVVRAAPIRSRLYEIALASAQYRAANRIHGHSYIDRKHTSGVGWSTHNPRPMTCLGVGGSNYAVARGSDGFYASKIGN